MSVTSAENGNRPYTAAGRVWPHPEDRIAVARELSLERLHRGSEKVRLACRTNRGRIANRAGPREGLSRERWPPVFTARLGCAREPLPTVTTGTSAVPSLSFGLLAPEKWVSRLSYLLQTTLMSIKRFHALGRLGVVSGTQRRVLSKRWPPSSPSSSVLPGSVAGLSASGAQ